MIEFSPAGNLCSTALAVLMLWKTLHPKADIVVVTKRVDIIIK